MIRTVRTLAALMTLSALCGPAHAQPQTDAVSLRAFEGHWACAGTFANGKPIASTLSAVWDAPSQALILHQDDRPPGAFHALELWGAHGATGFRATISDAYSGIRWLESPGWAGDRLTWTRMDGERPAERFVFGRPRDGAFTVDWLAANKSGDLVLGDTLTCKAVAA